MSGSNTINIGDTDPTGRQLLYGTSVKDVYHYHPYTHSGWESAPELSWYTDVHMPNDSFIDTYNFDNKWEFFTDFDHSSFVVGSGIAFTISGSKDRCGVSSEGKWSVDGDFEITLYIDGGLYYNEYRSSASIGLVLSKDDSNKVKVSRYFDVDSVVLGYGVHTVSGLPLRYIGWTEYSLTEYPAVSDVESLRVVRTDGALRIDAGNKFGYTTLVSGMDASFIGDSVYVSIEAETDQYNVFRAGVAGLAVSGTVTPSSIDMSDSFRGSAQPLPTNVLIVADDAGLSFINSDDSNLWRRLHNTANFSFTSVSGSISASDSIVCSVTSSGCSIIDFSNDSIKLYTHDGVWAKDGAISIASANTFSSFDAMDRPFIRSSVVRCAKSAYYGGNPYVSVGTENGLSVFSNGTSVGYTTTSGDVRALALSNNGSLWWHEYNEQSGEGVLYYKNDFSSVLGVDFSADGSFNKSFVDGISSNEINDIDSKDGFTVVGHPYGLDIIGGPYIRRLGYTGSQEKIADGYFAEHLGTYWEAVYSEASRNYFAKRDMHWSGTGYCARLGFTGSLYILSGAMLYITQDVDVTNISTIYFDVHVYNDSSYYAPYTIYAALDGSIEYSLDVTPHTSTFSAQSLDVSSYSGVVSLRLGLMSYSTNLPFSGVSVGFSAVTTMPVEYTDTVLSSNKPVTACKIVGDYGALKATYLTDDGYGIIDMHEYTEDFFYRHSAANAYTIHTL